MTPEPAQTRYSFRRRCRVALGVGALLLSLVLSACESGTNAATTTEAPDVAGVSGSVGPMSLDDVFIASGAPVATGASVTLRGAFTNRSGTPDQLVGVTTTAAASVVLLHATGTPSSGGITIPPQGQVDAVNGTPRIRLVNVTSPISVTQLVPVTFVFSTAGRVTLQVPLSRRGASSVTGSPGQSAAQS